MKRVVMILIMMICDNSNNDEYEKAGNDLDNDDDCDNSNNEYDNDDNNDINNCQVVQHN